MPCPIKEMFPVFNQFDGFPGIPTILTKLLSAFSVHSNVVSWDTRKENINAINKSSISYFKVKARVSQQNLGFPHSTTCNSEKFSKPTKTI